MPGLIDALQLLTSHLLGSIIVAEGVILAHGSPLIISSNGAIASSSTNICVTSPMPTSEGISSSSTVIFP